jgi:cytidylate kinase
VSVLATPNPPALAPVITVDGPSGSGKGTLAALIARELGWHLLDSGALYRIVAAVGLARHIDLGDGPALAAAAEDMRIEFHVAGVRVDGHELGMRIREEDVSAGASIVAAHPEVRHAVLALQLAQRRPPGLVADGRDMGTVVFPDAALKIYLDASLEARAERRYKQLIDKGLTANLRDLLAGLRERDERDKGRTVSPLKPAPDAFIIDSTSLSIDAVLALTLERARAIGLT